MPERIVKNHTANIIMITLNQFPCRKFFIFNYNPTILPPILPKSANPALLLSKAVFLPPNQYLFLFNPKTHRNFPRHWVGCRQKKFLISWWDKDGDSVLLIRPHLVVSLIVFPLVPKSRQDCSPLISSAVPEESRHALVYAPRAKSGWKFFTKLVSYRTLSIAKRHNILNTVQLKRTLYLKGKPTFKEGVRPLSAMTASMRVSVEEIIASLAFPSVLPERMIPVSLHMAI